MEENNLDDMGFEINVPNPILSPADMPVRGDHQLTVEDAVRGILRGVGVPYREFTGILGERSPEIVDRFALTAQEGVGNWWDYAHDYYGRWAAVSRRSVFDADYWMDWRCLTRLRVPPRRQEGHHYQKTGVLNDYSVILNQVMRMGSRGAWAFPDSNLDIRERRGSFADDVLRPMIKADWRGPSGILLDGMIHRLLNIQQGHRIAQPPGATPSHFVTEVLSNRGNGTWERRASAVLVELGREKSTPKTVPLVTEYHIEGTVFPSQVQDIKLFEVLVDYRVNSMIPANRWDYSAISDGLWDVLVHSYQRRDTRQIDYNNDRFQSPYSFAYYAPPPVPDSIRSLNSHKEFQALLANYQTPWIGRIINDWLQDHGVPPEDAVQFETPGHAALFPLML